MSKEDKGFQEGVRSWQPREMAMCSEFLIHMGMLKGSQTRVRLGTHEPEYSEELTEDERKMLRGVFSRWADCVYIDSKNVIIMEFKIKAVFGACEALEVYKQLFLSDPEYSAHHKKKIELWFVYALEDPVINMLARKRKIKAIQFTPSFLSDYLKLLNPHERRAPRTNL